MKFAYSTNTLRLRPLSDAVESIAKAGFSAMEIVADRPHAFPEDLTAAKIAELNRCLEQWKIKVCNLNSAVVTALPGKQNPSWLEEDWQQREMRIRYTLDCMRLGAAMGVPYVSTQGGGPIPETMNQKDAIRLFVANLHRVLPLAKKIGVKLLIEPGPSLLLESSLQTLELLKELDFNESLGVNFDAGHFFVAGEDPCQSWERLKPHVKHIHLEDISENRTHRHLQLGEGAMDIEGFLGCVRDSGYQGYVTVKLEPHDQGAAEIAAASARYLKERGFMSKGSETGVSSA